MVVTRDDISHAIACLGLSNKPICVHSSLRSFGSVQDGAEGVVQCFLEQGCTLLVPTFSWTYSVAPPTDLRPPRNGCGDYSWAEGKKQPVAGPIYNPQSDEIDGEDMGAIPVAILQMKGRMRGNHPLNSFTAIGPMAETLVAGQCAANVYAPLAALAELNGEVVLMGVGLQRLTALHLAEQMAGRNLFRRWSRDAAASSIMVEVGGCSEGFCKLESLLSPIERNIKVGTSPWSVFPVKPLLHIAHKAIQQNPLITHCGNSGCDRCNDAIAGGPVLS